VTNFLVPFTNLADLPAHEIQAEPEIRKFAARLEEIVERLLRFEDDTDDGDERDGRMAQ